MSKSSGNRFCRKWGLIDDAGYQEWITTLSIGKPVLRVVFLLICGDCFDIEESIDALYVWDKGRIIRYYKNNGKLIVEEFPYIHLQARKMTISSKLSYATIYMIVPDEFLPLEVE